MHAIGPTLSEGTFQSRVVQYARLLHWLCYHTWDSRRSAPGFPDLVLVRAPRLIFAELKVDGEDPRPEQQAWLDELRGCGPEVYLWRPEDWPAIVRILGQRP